MMFAEMKMFLQMSFQPHSQALKSHIQVTSQIQKVKILLQNKDASTFADTEEAFKYTRNVCGGICQAHFSAVLWSS